MDVVARIEAAASRWNVLDHPFYQRWSAGELTQAELAEYAAQYRYAVEALADAAAAAGDGEHAAEEREHVALWDAFAEGCGSMATDANAETLECASAWTAGEDRLERLAVLYAIESALPAVSQTKLEGLLGHYGFEEGPATEYFSLHAERDHRASTSPCEDIATDRSIALLPGADSVAPASQTGPAEAVPVMAAREAATARTTNARRRNGGRAMRPNISAPARLR